jgi:hypothetical protein
MARVTKIFLFFLLLTPVTLVIGKPFTFSHFDSQTKKLKKNFGSPQKKIKKKSGQKKLKKSKTQRLLRFIDKFYYPINAVLWSGLVGWSAHLFKQPIKPDNPIQQTPITALDMPCISSNEKISVDKIPVFVIPKNSFSSLKSPFKGISNPMPNTCDIPQQIPIKQPQPHDYFSELMSADPITQECIPTVDITPTVTTVLPTPKESWDSTVNTSKPDDEDPAETPLITPVLPQPYDNRHWIKKSPFYNQMPSSHAIDVLKLLESETELIIQPSLAPEPILYQLPLPTVTAEYHPQKQELPATIFRPITMIPAQKIIVPPTQLIEPAQQITIEPLVPKILPQQELVSTLPVIAHNQEKIENDLFANYGIKKSRPEFLQPATMDQSVLFSQKTNVIEEHVEDTKIVAHNLFANYGRKKSLLELQSLEIAQPTIFTKKSDDIATEVQKLHKPESLKKPAKNLLIKQPVQNELAFDKIVLHQRPYQLSQQKQKPNNIKYLGQ